MPQTYAFQRRLQFLANTTIVALAYVSLASYSNDALASSLRVIEGDILVEHNPYSRSITVPAASRPWANGIVPYRIDSSLPKSSVLSIKAAILRWNEVSGITLVSLNTDNKDRAVIAASSDVLVFQPGSGCASWVGRRGGAQEVWVAPNCTTGSVMHEIGHALGLEHEHTRPDRDQFITINWDNIDPAKRHNFNVAPAGSQALGDYDYDSIMHYGPKNFSVNNQITISPRYASIDTIGQRQSPSQGDLAAIAQLYATDLSVLTQVYPYQQTSEVAIHVSNDHEQGAHAIQLSVSVGEGQLREYNDDEWTCDSAVPGQVLCELTRLGGGANSVLLLNLDRFVPSALIRAEVSSKTHDDNLQNNANSADDEPVLGAATALQEDPVGDVGFGGGAGPGWFALLFFWLQRQSRCGIHRRIR